MHNYNIFRNNYGLIIFIIVIALIIPQLYYISNIEEFSYDLLLLAIPFFLGTIIFLLGTIFRLGEKWQLLLAGLGLSILLSDQFLKINIDQLDGSTGAITIEPLLASLNIMLYMGLPVALLLYGKRLKKILIDLSIVVFFLGVGVSFYSVYASLLLVGDSRDISTNLVAQSEMKSPNIYFIWLDAMETGYMKKYLSDSDADDIFSGFTLFENNSANYLYTLQSYPSFMSGTVFKKGDYKEWSKRGESLRKSLDAAGYRITSYAKKDFLSPLDDISYSSDDTYLKWTNFEHPLITDFIAYWVVRVAPGFLANQSLNIGKVLGGLMHTWVNQDSIYSNVKSIADGIEPLTGVFTLKRLISDEESRGDNNEFVIAHAVIPHGPYVIDKNCNYRGLSSKRPSDAYYDQVVCSSGLVKEFFEKLKKIDRYDSSLIIVMGDHGSGWADRIGASDDAAPPLNDKYMPWSKSMVLSRAAALLMIKPPKASAGAGLSISNKESQLVDIYPTIFSSIGFSDNLPIDIDGIDLYSNEIPNREKYFTYFKPSRIINPYNAEIYDLKYASPAGLIDLSYRSSFKDKNDLLIIKCNQVIDFSETYPSAEYYFSEGLGGFESSGRWSVGKKVRLKFKFPKIDCNQSTVIFRLNGFVTDAHPVLSSKIIFNGIKIGKVIFSVSEKNPQDFLFSIDPDLIRLNDINTIEFSIDNPVSPKDIGMSNDMRLLGLRFQHITFQ